MRFVYRTLAILALAMAAGLTHSWFVPVTTTFGGPDPRGERPAPPTPPAPPEGAETGEGGPDAGEGAAPGPETAPPPDQGRQGGQQGGEQAPDGAEDPTGEQTAAPPPPLPPDEIDISALGDFITAEEARAIWRAGFEQGDAFVAFLDARFAEQYAEGHITGARRLMSHEITDGTGAAALTWLLQQEPDHIVIYCEGGECDASKNLARQLERSGSFTREQMHVLQPGYPAWAELYPDLTTKGDQPGQP